MVSFLGRLGREDTTDHGVRVVLDMCWSGVCEGHGTDVPWTGMCTTGFGNSTRLLLRVAGRWRSTSLTALIRKQR